jgi:hypothetical protein
MRYLAFTLCVVGLLLSLLVWVGGGHVLPVLVFGYLVGTGFHD